MNIYVEEKAQGEFAIHGLTANHLVVLQKKFGNEYLRQGEARLGEQITKAIENPIKKEKK